MDNLKGRNPASEEAIMFSQGLIEHFNFQVGLYKIKSTHKTYTTDPRGLMIVGQPGVGKSRLATVYQRKFAKPSCDYKNHNTVLIVEMPSSCSIDWFYTKILSALGDPDPQTGRAPHKEQRILQLFKAQEVELLIIDEIHNLLPGDISGVQTRKIATTIKSLMNQTKVPIVLLGEERATALLSIDKAIESRFKTVYRLTNMGYNSAEERKYFKEYLASVQGLLKTPCVAFDSSDFALRMYAASAGNVREIKHIVTESIGSLSKNQSSIDYKILAYVFSEMGANPLRLTENPFSIRIEKLSKIIGLKA
jgi:DNA replication protein DnaC